MSAVTKIISIVLKAVADNKASDELSKELIRVSIDKASEAGVKKINCFINGQKTEISRVLSRENMESMHIPEDSIDYVIAEIKWLLSRIEITDEIFRQCKYKGSNLNNFLWSKYTEEKSGHIECEDGIKKGLPNVAEALIKLMYASENFEKGILSRIDVSIDNVNTELKKVSKYLEENTCKVDADLQMILDILKTILERTQNFNVQKMEMQKSQKKKILYLQKLSSLNFSHGCVANTLYKSLFNIGDIYKSFMIVDSISDEVIITEQTKNDIMMINDLNKLNPDVIIMEYGLFAGEGVWKLSQDYLVEVIAKGRLVICTDCRIDDILGYEEDYMELGKLTGIYLRGSKYGYIHEVYNKTVNGYCCKYVPESNDIYYEKKYKEIFKNISMIYIDHSKYIEGYGYDNLIVIKSSTAEYYGGDSHSTVYRPFVVGAVSRIGNGYFVLLCGDMFSDRVLSLGEGCDNLKLIENIINYFYREIQINIQSNWKS